MTEMGGGGVVVIVMTAATDLVESCTEVAVIVTVAPAGTVEGAVYVVDVPLPVVAVLNDPHALEVPQVTDQVTLALDELLVTTAESCVDVPVDSDVGGAVAN
ncbi:MAG: hypothetical protein WB439_04295 [Acidobacteriaceae bacterium]